MYFFGEQIDCVDHHHIYKDFAENILIHKDPLNSNLFVLRMDNRLNIEFGLINPGQQTVYLMF